MKHIKKFIKENKLLMLALLLFIIYLVYKIGFNIYGTIKKHEPDLVNVKEYEVYHYKDNEYHFGTISDEDIAKYYYKDFINILVNDIDKSYEYLSDDAKLDLFNNNINFYKEKISNYILDTKSSSTINEYAYTKHNSGNILSVIDSDNLIIIFEEEAIWKYKVLYIGIS